VLDLDTIAQLRAMLSVEMRTQLVNTFDQQRDQCVRDLEDAVHRGDRTEIRRVAHLLKGSSASLGATALLASCETLEHVSRPGDPAVSEGQVTELRVVAAAAGDELRRQLI
jgi:HPt (histidine-containing phosphotransfer) domain-containing protein